MPGFPDLWLWAIFAVVGLLLVVLEFVIGVQTGFDLVFIGSAFIIGGLATYPVHSWLVTAIVTSVICVAYVFLGRRYVHRWTQVKKARTNIDAIVGRKGVVLRNITNNVDGLVKVGNEQWRARGEKDIKKGDEIVVTNVSGVTLDVEKIKGGN
jgi:membrane protein implicated in regulation of membrane protease activity